nr:MAG TPA: hypothetical protein [Caudoviricetes sp.]
MLFDINRIFLAWAQKSGAPLPAAKVYSIGLDTAITTASRGERTACIGVPPRHKKSPNAVHQANSLALSK